MKNGQYVSQFVLNVLLLRTVDIFTDVSVRQNFIAQRLHTMYLDDLLGGVISRLLPFARRYNAKYFQQVLKKKCITTRV